MNDDSVHPTFVKRELELRRLAALLRSGSVDMKQHTGQECEMLFRLLDELDAAIAFKADAPRCAMCGTTDNLVEIIPTPEGSYHLCPKHLAEERRES